jgi:hypothetical protein
MRRAIVLTGLALACGAAPLRAEPDTAQYAPAQLEVAQAQLEQAQVALAQHDYAAARRLAAQAQLDARLAWSMTESPFLRRAAVELNRRAERLRRRGLLAAGASP